MFFRFPIVRFAVSMLLAVGLTGCGEDAAAPAATIETLCVDTKSGEVVVVSGETVFPTINSQTGAATLVPGMYCPKCQTWHVAPPVEQLQRQKGVAHCPKSKAVLAIDGPTPASARRQP